MHELLKIGQTVHTESSNIPCTVEQFLGGGGQGEVYQANLGGQSVAVKWYFPHYLKADLYQRARLETGIDSGSPSDRFLWPFDLVSEPSMKGFGYMMPLRPSQHKSLVDLMRRRIQPTFRSLATAGFQLADSFLQLHSRGLSYCDISFGNVSFDPTTGDISICDNDNVTTNNSKQIAIAGTPGFMAPEIVMEQALPSTQTDLYSLAVLLFYMFIMHHPLEGKKELEHKCFDPIAMNKLYGSEALFIFDPKDRSNEPIPGQHDNALIFWQIYPQFLRDLFTKAFTSGIRDPEDRVRESEWRRGMIRLRDAIVYCSHCGEENFYDADLLQTSSGKLNSCWNCKQEIRLPPRMRIDKNIVMLNHNTKLFPHHINNPSFDFSNPIAEVSQHPTNPSLWGIKNLGTEKWVCTTTNGELKDVPPGRNMPMEVGTKINFGKTEGEIRS